jgi:hypothetical protein
MAEQKTESKGSKVVTTVLGIVGAVVLIVVINNYRTGKADKQVKKEMQEVLQGMPGYEENSEYYQSLFEACHEPAFKDSFRVGTRRTPSKLDQKKYLTLLFDMMSRKAEEDGREEVAETITLYAAVIEAAEDES